MRKITAIIAFALLFTFNAEGKKIDGMIITSTDTLNVTLRVLTNFFTGEINYPALQRKVRYIDENGKKQRIRPDKAEEIRFRYRGEDVRMLSRTVPSSLAGFFSNSEIFLRLRNDGPLKLFTHYARRNNSTDFDNDNRDIFGDDMKETSLLQKGNAAIKNPRFFKFRKDMMKYLDDCSALVDKLEAKDFKRWDIFEMVAYYNTNCN